MRLNRYTVVEDEMLPANAGRLVLFSDVQKMVEEMCTAIEAFRGAANDPANEIFLKHPEEVWYAVVDRDFATAAQVWHDFASENGL